MKTISMDYETYCKERDEHIRTGELVICSKLERFFRSTLSPQLWVETYGDFGMYTKDFINIKAKLNLD